MGPVPNTWTIEEHSDGVDLKLNRRSFAYDLDDIDEACRRIRRSHRYSPGDTVTVVEKDGYRHKVKP